jgi:hypothetical protein
MPKHSLKSFIWIKQKGAHMRKLYSVIFMTALAFARPADATTAAASIKYRCGTADQKLSLFVISDSSPETGRVLMTMNSSQGALDGQYPLNQIIQDPQDPNFTDYFFDQYEIKGSKVKIWKFAVQINGSDLTKSRLVGPDEINVTISCR